MSSEQERRQFRRYPLRLRAILRSGSEEVEADVINASVGGCLLRTHLKVQAGDVIEVSIPDLQVPPTSMVVVRSTPTDEAGHLVATCFESPVADEATLAGHSSEKPTPSSKPTRPN
ncbi:PilZ domain-containing protein [Archangium violaceum]|uniref:PilZ domain-containing protein n=1 Tax=Archangium violaceum TaxID=83451 RepID=UPI00194DB45C|nr:PilZ domain-containing protein [Archangium violaceum]QRO01935.1 PilZ domain-containing protein [Archangium violaceum]